MKRLISLVAALVTAMVAAGCQAPAHDHHDGSHSHGEQSAAAPFVCRAAQRTAGPAERYPEPAPPPGLELVNSTVEPVSGPIVDCVLQYLTSPTGGTARVFALSPAPTPMVEAVRTTGRTETVAGRVVQITETPEGGRTARWVSGPAVIDIELPTGSVEDLRALVVGTRHPADGTALVRTEAAGFTSYRPGLPPAHAMPRTGATLHQYVYFPRDADGDRRMTVKVWTGFATAEDAAVPDSVASTGVGHVDVGPATATVHHVQEGQDASVVLVWTPVEGTAISVQADNMTDAEATTFARSLPPPTP